MNTPNPRPNCNSSESDSSNTIVVVIDGAGDYTVRPSSPEMVESHRRRREKEQELLRFAEEHKEELERLKQNWEADRKRQWGNGE